MELILQKKAENYTGQFTAINELLLRIHTATGWRLPKSAMLCEILCRQLQKKLAFDFPGITHDEVETAFMKFGTEENFTGSMSIALIDRVLKKYFASVAQENFDQERQQVPAEILPLPTPSQHLNECRELIEHKYRLYLEKKLNIELLPPFIWPVLCNDYNVDPELPMQFIQEAKEFIAERKEGKKFGRGATLGEVLTKHEPSDIESVCTKLAIEYCFERLKNLNYEHLYTREEPCF